MDGGKCNPKDKSEAKMHTLMLNWITCVVFIFYFNFLSMLIFVILSRFYKFRTLREKAGLGGNMRNTVDFLEFC